MYPELFAIQMGAPTDASTSKFVKRAATQVLLTSYRLVEEVFNHDIEEFLNTKYEDLIKITKENEVKYSDSLKEEYSILIFPEAYACLKPLTSQKKLDEKMSLMVDIGGGTTDISFFCLENGQPSVYRYWSINKGLNYLTNVDINDYDPREDSNVKSEAQINKYLLDNFFTDIKTSCTNLVLDLKKMLIKQTDEPVSKLDAALRNRPVIFTGGGSYFPKLTQPINSFKEVNIISGIYWNKKEVVDIKEIENSNLFGLLSTAYGLAISENSDNIVLKPFEDFFELIRRDHLMHRRNEWSGGKGLFEGYDHGLDYDAYK